MIYFLNNTQSDKEIKDQPTTLQQAIELFYYLPEEYGCFFGLRNDRNQIIQFMWDGENKWLIDMPVNAKVAFQRSGDFDECKAIIASFFDSENVIMKFQLKQVALQ